MIAKIKVLSLDHDRVIGSKRLICSPGLYRASNCEVEQGFYASDTLLPKDLWTEASSEILTSKPSLFKPTEHIGFFGIKKSQLAKLSDLHAKYEKTRLQVKFQQAEVKSFVDEIGNSLFERFPFEGQPTSLGLGFNSSGLTTVTVDYKAGCKTGLHYDSWFGVTAAQRSSNQFRIMTNLGPGTRWLLFANLTLSDLLESLKQFHPNANINDNTPIQDVNCALLESNPAVYALRLDQGDGYIAATEAVFHDATTRWSDLPNANLQKLGVFQW